MVASPRPPALGSDPGLSRTLAASGSPETRTDDATQLADDGEGRTLAADDGPRSSSPSRLVAGAAIGRYILQTRLGEGGMGVVWTAHDPELDRPVAIKLLTSPRSDSQARLLREAQAMAKLAHPNVVAVFDVGLHLGQVYVAMELVHGATLRAWIDADPRRPWRTILGMFLQAGRGLAAAHAAGLVHRDFKPDNALVGEDGRLRVLDFGLAALARDAPALTSSHAGLRPLDAGNLHNSSVSAAIGVSALNSQLTLAGAVMGTLAYMSPEQHLGVAADHRSDQFSFCVALYAALHGQRPFAGETAGALALNVIDGKLRPPPRGSRLPGRIDRALRRGLAANPERRYPGMDALLADLSRETWPRRQRWLLGGVAAALLGAAAAAVALRPAPAICVDPRQAWASLWDDATRAELRARFAATGQPFAAAAADGFITRIDAYLAAWSELRARACDEHQRGAIADSLYMRQRDCQQRLLGHAAATIAVQRSADATAVTHAIAAAEALPALSRCADAGALRAEVAPPEDAALAEAITRLEAAIVRAEAEATAGRYRRAREMLLAVLAQPELARHPPTHADALMWLGMAELRLGNYPVARDHLLEAHWIALAAGADETALGTAALLPDLLIEELGDREAGRQWLRTGEALLARTGLQGSNAQLNLLYGWADLATAEKATARAVAFAREAVALVEATDGPAALNTGHALAALGQALRGDGQLAASLAVYERAQAILAASLSPEHPHMAQIANNKAVTLEIDQPERALAEFERALAILDRSIGGETVMLAALLSNVADLQAAAGDAVGAERSGRRAVALYEALLGPVPRTGLALDNLAGILIRIGQPRAARDIAVRSAAVFTRSLGPDAYEVSYPLHNMAVAEHLLGDCVSARRHFQRSIEISERSVGRDDPGNAPGWRGLGQCALAEGHPREALAHFERALALTRAGGSPQAQLFARFHVATARFALGEHELARAEIRAVRDALPARDLNVEPHHRAELERWIADHGL
ncbi:serine/threonine-protein kinase [Nannocystis sp.]|uniref:serine/threonine-protein kinase n=1 Tax=Nannocystis sp. TaxID=1962667 RepID=UPI0025CF80FB|nr:serine/threonine-protein kinase [Nannocystis sp.]MBK7824275.1 tetratricopeptide repeat protein [Nannocystis sp.]